MKKMHGVITAMITPFAKDDSVDFRAIQRLTDFYIDKGVHCLYPTGTTGEVFLLSEEERKKIAETVIDRTAGRTDVFIHVGAMTLKETVNLAKHARDAGADGIGVVTPAYFSVNDREIEEYYVDISKSLPEDFPIYLYNIPQLSGNDLKTSTVQKIVDRCRNIKGIKYSYHDMLRVNEYLSVKSDGFCVVVGADRLLLPALSIGCSGTVSGVSSVCPEPFVAVYDAFMKGNLEKAREQQRIANSVVEVLKCGSNMSYFKVALKARGIDAGHMRRPLMDIDGKESEAFLLKFSALLENNGIPLNT